MHTVTTSSNRADPTLTLGPAPHSDDVRHYEIHTKVSCKLCLLQRQPTSTETTGGQHLSAPHVRQCPVTKFWIARSDEEIAPPINDVNSGPSIRQIYGANYHKGKPVNFW